MVPDKNELRQNPIAEGAEKVGMCAFCKELRQIIIDEGVEPYVGLTTEAAIALQMERYAINMVKLLRASSSLLQSMPGDH